MAGIGECRLLDALRQPHRPIGDCKGGKPKRRHQEASKQARGAEGEQVYTRWAEASSRDRMMDIRQGNQQAGRHQAVCPECQDQLAVASERLCY